MNDVELFRLIGSIARKATREVNQEVKPYKLDNNLFLYLLRIMENPGITQRELIEIVQVDKTTMSKALKKLIEQGYIKKEVNHENKNFKKLLPNEKAYAIKQQLINIEENYVKQETDALSSDEKQLLYQLLLKIKDE
ncbi:MarR family winged helix-turn-helix transcriptional regulator [Fructilactobacillus frigidiflavus]|uniref:MarR family winged helix-turn-helix transcriptional regulator n=1 Tax=Fructilactobacillus frigidiflavus TaxID=3242688 RepID=UPI003757E11B